MVFIDLEKAYDRVPRQEVWKCMREKGVPEKYVMIVGETGVGCHTGWLSHCQYLIRWMAVPCGGLHVTCA